MLRGEDTHWSRLEQRDGGQEVWRGFGTQRSRLEQKGGGREVWRVDHTNWSQLQQNRTKEGRGTSRGTINNEVLRGHGSL